MERQLLVHRLLQSQLCTFQIHCRAQGLVRLRRPSWLKSLIKMQQWGWSDCRRDWVARERKWFGEVSYMRCIAREVRINLTIVIQKREVNVQFKRIHISFLEWKKPAHSYLLLKCWDETPLKRLLRMKWNVKMEKREGRKVEEKKLKKKLFEKNCLINT